MIEDISKMKSFFSKKKKKTLWISKSGATNHQFCGSECLSYSLLHFHNPWNLSLHLSIIIISHPSHSVIDRFCSETIMQNDKVSDVSPDHHFVQNRHLMRIWIVRDIAFIYSETITDYSSRLKIAGFPFRQSSNSGSFPLVKNLL
jgi:hypothetical protein